MNAAPNNTDAGNGSKAICRVSNVLRSVAWSETFAQLRTPLVKAGPWTLPVRLQRLIESGWWPSDSASAMRQNLYPLIAEDRVRAFASDESVIHFVAPPFFTVSALVASNERYWTSEMASPSGISFDHAVVIGDFGLGSDAPIVLDYRTNAVCPSVLRLRFGETFPDGQWVTAAPDFDAMCDILRIDQS